MGKKSITNKFILKTNNYEIIDNFSFRIKRTNKSFQQVASISAKRKYASNLHTDMKIGDVVSISVVQNNEKEELFQGNVTSISITLGFIKFEAQFSFFEYKQINETHKDTSRKQVMTFLVPEIQYQAAEDPLPQIVLSGSLERVSHKLLTNKNFYISNDKKLIVTDTPKKGNTWDIKSIVESIKRWTVRIFENINIELNDIVELNGCKYAVNGITTYKTNQQFRKDLSIEFLEKSDNVAKEEKLSDEEHLELSEYFDNPERLVFLTEEAKANFIQLVKIVKSEMKDRNEKFEKVFITSEKRTYESQMKILSKKMRYLSGDGNPQNMFEYYEEHIRESYVGKSSTLNYLYAIQHAYDGTPIELLDIKRWSKIPLKHQEEILQIMTLSKEGDFGIDIKSPRTIGAEELLLKYMSAHVFLPSFHIGDKISVIDIRSKENKELTASNVVNKNKSLGRKGYIKSVSEGEPHAHLGLVNPKK